MVAVLAGFAACRTESDEGKPFAHASALARDLDALGSDPGRIEMLSTLTRVVRMTPEASTATVDIPFDDPRLGAISVLTPSPTVDVAIVSPTGERIVASEVGIPSLRVGERGYERLIAGFTTLFSQGAPVGTYRVEVRETEPFAGPRGAVVSVTFESDVKVGLAPFARSSTRAVGEPVYLSMLVQDGDTKVTNALDVRAELRTRSGDLVSPLVFRDDGTEGDLTAGDGVFTGVTVLPTEGEFEVSAYVQGGSRAGTLYARSAWLPLRAVSGAGRITEQQFTENAIDDDGDGLFDRLVLTPPIADAAAGIYELSVTLHTSTGRSTTLQSFVDTRTEAPIALSITAEQLRSELGSAGPLYIDRVSLARDDGAAGFVPVDDAYRFSPTAPRDLATFSRPAIDIDATRATKGREVDGGFEIDVPVDVLRAGTYVLTGSIADAAFVIDEARPALRGEANLAAGRGTITLRVTGDAPLGEIALGEVLILGDAAGARFEADPRLVVTWETDGGSVEPACAPIDLQAAKAYEPSRWQDGRVVFDEPVAVHVPERLWVTTGNAGNHRAFLTLPRPEGARAVRCTYRGGSDQAHPAGGEQIAKGASYILESCDAPLDTGRVVLATGATLRVDNGSFRGGTTTVVARLRRARCPAVACELASAPSRPDTCDDGSAPERRCATLSQPLPPNLDGCGPIADSNGCVSLCP
jgi:hypothetical protein